MVPNAKGDSDHAHASRPYTSPATTTTAGLGTSRLNRSVDARAGRFPDGRGAVRISPAFGLAG